MNKTIKINSGSVVPTDTIRFVRPIGEVERARIVERYGEEAAGFNIAIQFADRSTKLARETLDAVRAQGIGLVNVGAERFVPATNIREASPFTNADAEKLTGEKGYTLGQTFRSRVETTAGVILSSATPEQVMQRREKALGSAAAGTGSGSNASANASGGAPAPRTK
ncbi:MAG: hypothetical protein GC150_07315 [Rhizobiales bacterium]|nr:hypothetical protein [Hyphomicrobiales bacterium]